MKSSILLLALLILPIDTCQSINDVYYSSSISEMVYLQRLKHLLISKLEIYAKELKNKFHIMKNGIAQLEIQLGLLEKHVELEEDHEINYFKTLRRQYFDWTYWLTFLKEDMATAAQEYIQEMRQYLPIQDDYEGALISVFLILDVYLIKPQDFAEGLLKGRQYKSRLDALDCYALAQFALKNNYYNYPQKWFYLSWLYHTELDELQEKYYQLLGFDPIDFLKIFTTYLLKINKKVIAWDALDLALSMVPSDVSIYRQLRLIEKDLYNLSEPPATAKRTYIPDHRKCCRGEFDYPKGLSCYYDYGTEPFLRLAPFKIEPLNRNPFVAIYHDVLYDSEIEELKSLSLPIMTRSFIYNEHKATNEASRIRTSNSAFLNKNISSVVETINRRIMDITKLNVSPESSNELQVMNYGLGGHYAPHFDWFPPNYPLHRGNRLATVLIYLTDVTQGGATVFPLLRLAYFPKKGSALIFRNLNNNMTGDLNTLHSGCPVLFGNKWAATKWIFSADQMFRSPCLSEYIDKSMYK